MIKTLKNIKFLATFILSDLIILAMIFYAMTMNNTINDIYAPLADTTNAIKYELVLSQLAIEHAETHDTTSSAAKKAIAHINNAETYARKILANHLEPALHQDTKLALKHIVLLKSWMITQSTMEPIEETMTKQPTTTSFHQALAYITQAETLILDMLSKERAKLKDIYHLMLFGTAMLLLLVSIHYRRGKARETKYLQKLKKTASTDALTGINNRRCFDENLHDAWGHAFRGSYPISIALCDIDFFKKYNDSLGHQAGDICLKKVADIMRQTLRRPVDKVARYGGEEFAFLLPFTDSDGAAKIMSKLHKNLQHAAIPHPASSCSDSITLSIGIFTMLPETNITTDTAVNNADQALYRAKDAGRNQTCHYDETHTKTYNDSAHP